MTSVPLKFSIAGLFRIMSWSLLFIVPMARIAHSAESWAGDYLRLGVMTVTVIVSIFARNIRFAGWVWCIVSFYRCRVGEFWQDGTLLDCAVPVTVTVYSWYCIVVLASIGGICMAFPRIPETVTSLLTEVVGYVIIGCAWHAMYMHLIFDVNLRASAILFLDIWIVCVICNIVDLLLRIGNRRSVQGRAIVC